MQRRVLLASALGVLVAGAAAAALATRDPAKVPAGSYALDPRRASLAVRTPIMGGLSRHTMRFVKLSGGFDYDPASWQATKVEIIVDPRAIDAGDGRFSQRMVSYFEPQKYPVIAFASTALTADAEGRGELAGRLTMHGVTRPIMLKMTFRGVGQGARMGFSGSGRIKRSDFGLTIGRPFAGDVVDLVFDVEFVKKQPG